MSLKSSVVILQTVIPDYRLRIFNYLKSLLKENLTLISGKSNYNSSILTDVQLQDHYIVKNHFLFSGRFSFQTGIFLKCMKADVLIMEMNPRIISNWILLLLRRFSSRKKNIVWGHAWPRSGKNSKSDRLRGLMRTLADGVLVYTQTQKMELLSKCPKLEVFAAPNSLYFSNEMVMESFSDKAINIIYVGRLIKNKKIELLLNAFSNVVSQLPDGMKLVLIGDGPLRKELEGMVRKLNIEKKVVFVGHVSDYDELKKYYSESLVSVSPGYVGLQIIQSLSFGVPLIYSLNEKHAPEIEAAIPDFNSCTFMTDSVEDLSKTLLNVARKEDFWNKRRKLISEDCKMKYSIEKMGEGFMSVINFVTRSAGL